MGRALSSPARQQALHDPLRAASSGAQCVCVCACMRTHVCVCVCILRHQCMFMSRVWVFGCHVLSQMSVCVLVSVCVRSVPGVCAVSSVNAASINVLCLFIAR